MSILSHKWTDNNDGTLTITIAEGPCTGKCFDIFSTVKQHKMGLEAHKTKNIQEAFPHLDDDEREFLMSGLNPLDWDRLIGLIEQEAQEENFSD